MVAGISCSLLSRGLQASAETQGLRGARGLLPAPGSAPPALGTVHTGRG